MANKPMRHHSAKPYFIIAKNGITSKRPFPHATRKDALEEAKRLAEEFPDQVFYIYRYAGKVVSGNAMTHVSLSRGKAHA